MNEGLNMDGTELHRRDEVAKLMLKKFFGVSDFGQSTELWDRGCKELADDIVQLFRVDRADLKKQVNALEAFRPHWAKGYSNDSIAAQTTTVALAGLWKMLGVKDQTAAVLRLRELLRDQLA